MLKVAMVIPPMSNLNTPYAAAPRLAGWLRSLGHHVDIVDLNLETFLRLYSRDGLSRLFAAVDPATVTGEGEDIFRDRDRYIRVIDDVVSFLQGRDPSLAHRINRRDLLPEGPSFRRDDVRAAEATFGTRGKGDRARHLATLMLLDLVEFFRTTLTPHFGLLEYAEKLASPRPSYDEMAAEIARPRNVVETIMLECAESAIAPDVDLVCVTCPFPGMLLASLLLGDWLVTARPRARRALGGGFPSTELRSMSEPRVFDAFDYVVLDDGEVPLQQICARVAGEAAPLHNTFVREDGAVKFYEATAETPRFRDFPTPDYTSCRMDRYVHLLYSSINPVFRILNEGAWLKLTAAHGCYWKQCTFCDVHLPYIGDFDPLPARQLADQMDALHAQTGLSSFHFTDEAAPPSLLVKLALELLRRGRNYQFWGNVRYDTHFTPDRCRLLAAAGMIAVTGGIEVASDELLPKIAKGITVPHVIKVLQAFAAAGIFTHAYLIYGFPGETAQDTINSLDIIRQLCRAKILQSAFYHQFSLTAHSPIGKKPELFGIRAMGPKFGGFADYARYHLPLAGAPTNPHVRDRLQAALDHYFERGTDRDARSWFAPGEFPPSSIANDYAERMMSQPHPAAGASTRICWLGGLPRWRDGLLDVTTATGDVFSTPAPVEVARELERCHPSRWTEGPPQLAELGDPTWFEPLRRCGLVVV